MLYFSSSSQVTLVLDFAFCTKEQMMWQQQELKYQQKKQNEEEDGDIQQMLLQRLFLEQLCTVQYCLWTQKISINWWKRFVL